MRCAKATLPIIGWCLCGLVTHAFLQQRPLYGPADGPRAAAASSAPRAAASRAPRRRPLLTKGAVKSWTDEEARAWLEEVEGPPGAVFSPTEAELRSMSWMDCDDGQGDGVQGRPSMLQEQLVRVRDALVACNTSHVLAYGTLIGAMRDGGANAWEVDNDLIYWPDGTWPRIDRVPTCVLRALWERGLIVALKAADRVQICNNRPDGTQRSDAALAHPDPWGVSGVDDGHLFVYFVYTDIFRARELPAALRAAPVVRRPYGGTWMFTFDDAAAEAHLDAEYGRGAWRLPPDRRSREKFGVDLAVASDFGPRPWYPVGLPAYTRENPMPPLGVRRMRSGPRQQMYEKLRARFPRTP
eukprot:TRINITY_DN2230_c0_g6_i1.p1 TRINITY_DN2230_c0_g6~~TRINITY_DN2230_c0_g6_i1.p1  ORF type:complete len:355 (+),score=48.40 TRINITY_DN2230_c0_g6_i1:57-1121(+)